MPKQADVNYTNPLDYANPNYSLLKHIEYILKDYYKFVVGDISVRVYSYPILFVITKERVVCYQPIFSVTGNAASCHGTSLEVCGGKLTLQGGKPMGYEFTVLKSLNELMDSFQTPTKSTPAGTKYPLTPLRKKQQKPRSAVTLADIYNDYHLCTHIRSIVKGMKKKTHLPLLALGRVIDDYKVVFTDTDDIEMMHLSILDKITALPNGTLFSVASLVKCPNRVIAQRLGKVLSSCASDSTTYKLLTTYSGRAIYQLTNGNDENSNNPVIDLTKYF